MSDLIASLRALATAQHDDLSESAGRSDMEIKTWVERCNDHPDHQTGMVSNDMIHARMCEEIADLRAEVERLRGRSRRDFCSRQRANDYGKG